MATIGGTLQQRVRRFLDEDATTFALTTSLGVGAFVIREFQAVVSSSSAHRLTVAARKTLPMVPAIVISSAVGIVGMKVTLAAVQDIRRDYSRTSVLIAVPVCAAILHAPGGPRLMAKAAIGYGGFILAVDSAASCYHRYNALQLEELREYERDHDDLIGHSHLRDSDVFIRHGVFHDTHNAAAFSRDPSTLLAQHFGEK